MRLRLVLAITTLMSVLWGQGWYNHPELVWESFETEHFLIHFHQGTERSAREAATVAEKIYGPVTRMYRHEPAAKTHLIIKDVDDDSNGLAYFFDNKIEIWARPLDYDLRGSHRWMQDVITHEFVHIVQLATAMKFTSRVPSLYFQVIDYEDEKREDVLYGYPNVIVSYPYPGVNIPPWFAEGVAQYMYPGANYDFWDTHRDMIVRDRVLNDNLLSLAAMNTFGKRGIGNESAYNQGFAFVSYLVRRFGVQVLEQISRRMSAPLSVSISRAMKKATGSDGRRLYREWKTQLEDRYGQEMMNVQAHGVTGDILVDQGTTNLHPVWHPSDRKFAFLSNRAADFFGQTDLYVYDMETAELEPIATSAISAPSWSPDGKLLYYARRSKPGKTGARWLDLFAYDLETEKEQRLTHAERVTSPVLVGEGTVAYITLRDGTSNIRLLELAGSQPANLTSFEAGEVIHSLTYRPEDSLLIFDATLNHGRQLFRVNLASGKVEPHHPETPAPQSDVREPDRGPGGMLLSADATGVFNLYWIGDDGDQGYVTNVPGGAFMPSVNRQGEVLYSLYDRGGYKIAYLAHPEVLDPAKVGISSDFWAARPGSPQEQPDSDLLPQPYLETMSKPFILPRLTIDYGTVKPGFYFYANEVLDRLLLFGGASVNRLGDTDYFLLFEFAKFRPTLYAQIYAIQRHVSQDFTYYDYNGTNDLRFNLLEGVVGGRMPLGAHRFWLELTHSRYNEQITQRIGSLSGALPSFPYYIGTALSTRWQFSTRRPEYGGNMFPTKGYEITTEIRGEKNDLIQDFGINEDYGTLQPSFAANNLLRLTFNYKQYIALHRRSKIAVAYEAKIGWLSNQGVDDFFYFFGGGPPGLRGYTYYDSTAQGPNLMVHTVTLRVPVFLEQHIPFGQLTLQNVSVGLVAQYGDAFSGSWLHHDYKSSAGIELRFGGHSFYVFPFALTYEIHRPVGSHRKQYRQFVSLLFDF